MKSLGLSTASIGYFPRGAVELVEYFIRKKNAEMREIILNDVEFKT